MEYFINQAMDNAIKDFLESKQSKNSIVYNSFLVVVIRSLEIIYDKLDIIGPYQSKNVELFKQNMMKFGFSESNLNTFFDNMNNFFNDDKNKIVPNKYFIEIEKQLIDMFIQKKVSFGVSNQDIINFRKLLYSPNSNSEIMISYNFLNSKDEKEIIKYFNIKLDAIIDKKISEPKKLLAPEAYRVINKNYTDIALLTAQDVELINDMVYSKLEVNKNAINFEYMFEKALKNFYNKKEPITSGNGYVDILLVLGIIITIVMVIIIVTITVG